MTLRQRLRYRFDNYMARGVGAQILLLGGFTGMLVVITVTLAFITRNVPETDGKADSFGRLAWKSLMHALDPGTLGGDAGSWTFLVIMLFITIGGLFVLSALIGILTQGFGTMIDTWRRGRSNVIEKNHTVILGWGPKIPTLLHELAVANANQRNACVVILADRDKVDMDAEASEAVRGTRLRVVTRHGSPMTLDDLRIVSLPTSKAIVVLAPELPPNEADTVVLKTLLAIAKLAPKQALHLVAELHDERTESVARMVIGDHAALLRASPLVSRLLVQTGRQSGLSVVYTELLDFEGVEIYLQPQPSLVGKTFREVVFAYDTSSVIGVRTRAGEMLLPPPLDRVLEAGDEVVAISEDDSTVHLDGKGKYEDTAIVPCPPARTPVPESTLVLGVCARTATVLFELDAYVAPGSRALVVGESDLAPAATAGLQSMTVEHKRGDITDRDLLESLNVTAFDHILVLSEAEGRSQEMADARTTVALLHIRDLERRAGKSVPITSEILDIDNRDLAAVAEADDFIVSNTLVSLMVSQIAENPHLVRVFDELFSPSGYELYLKPANEYVRSEKIKFGTVCEAALRRNEIAIGYRLAEDARDAKESFGVVVNPSKRSQVTLGSGDKIIVLAES
jgi:hypothetical protein